jgi:hypothetical protein
MKRKNILATSALSLASIALAAGFAFSAYAQDTNTATTENRVRGQHFQINTEMSAEQKADFEAKRAEREKAMELKRAAMQTAVNSGNYDTWVAAVKAQMGEDAPILEKVTADNFAQFVEAHKLMVQAQEKFKAIGLDEGMGMGMGQKMGHGQGRGLGLGNHGSTATESK